MSFSQSFHTALFNAFELQDGLVGWGIVFGFGHWVIAGMALGMVGSMHPGIKAGEQTDPGLFAKNLPTMNMMGFLMVHILYGVVVGGLYEAWA